MSSSLPIPTDISISDAFGSAVLGASFSLILYGMAVQQTLVYSVKYPKDRLFLKIWVTLMMVIETVHSVAAIHAIYFFLVTNYNHPESLVHNSWSLNILSVLQAGSMVMVQTFYIWRIYVLRHTPIYVFVISVISVLILAELAFGLGVTIRTFLNPFTFQFKKITWMISALNGCALPADVLLSVTLVWILGTSRTGFRKTDTMVKHLVLYTIETGVLTALCSIITFSLSVAFPGKTYYVGSNMTATRVYANSFLAILNSRKHVAKGLVDAIDEHLGGLELKTLPRSPNDVSGSWNVPFENPASTTAISIKVDKSYVQETNHYDQKATRSTDSA
ncbi:hypothetical protein C8Q74DRAFT_1283086 [Fomes fomentarius]|nr:hypothetical protein C8Q74DRAFT_1283086 [Fomes fomentarius]